MKHMKYFTCTRNEMKWRRDGIYLQLLDKDDMGAWDTSLKFDKKNRRERILECEYFTIGNENEKEKE